MRVAYLAVAARFANLATADLDLARMGLALDRSESLTATIHNGSPVPAEMRLGLVGGGWNCAATLDGAPIAAHRDHARLLLTLPLVAGDQHLTVTCGS
jgi:hypothetical protein